MLLFISVHVLAFFLCNRLASDGQVCASRLVYHLRISRRGLRLDSGRRTLGAVVNASPLGGRSRRIVCAVSGLRYAVRRPRWQVMPGSTGGCRGRCCMPPGGVVE